MQKMERKRKDLMLNLKDKLEIDQYNPDVYQPAYSQRRSIQHEDNI